VARLDCLTPSAAQHFVDLGFREQRRCILLGQSAGELLFLLYTFDIAAGQTSAGNRLTEF
jgi:hypothetical protein